MLELSGLHKRYRDVAALDGLDLNVAPGQMLGFLGPNGAGKTTAMRSVFGLVRPDSGSVTWGGARIDASVRRRFGYMPEERGLYPKMRVHDQLVYFGRLHGLSAAEAAMVVDRWLGLLGLEDRAGSKVDELSHGNQQRVQLAAALVHDPELLVLDEPFVGLDPIASLTMARLLRQQADDGVAVLFSSHQLDVVEDLCEDVVIINDGRVVLAGRVSKLRAASRRRYLDVVLAEGADPAALHGIDGASVTEIRGDRVRLLVAEGTDLPRLAGAIAGVVTVTQFAYQPPALSEVFREAVSQ
jgi:ABC-2 type transport system ATP-binding protein